MNFTCPHCQNSSRINQPKAGKFKPKCPKCKKAFVLVIDNAGKVQTFLVPSKPPTQPADSEAPAKSSVSEQVISAGESAGSGPLAEPTIATSKPIEQTNADQPDVGTTQPAPAEISGEMTEADASQEFETMAFQQEATEGGADLAETAAAKPQAKTPDTIPRRLGGYKIDGQLGQGGMGTVFRAKQVSLDRDVALKVLKPSLTKNPSFVSRFVREAFAAAQLVHHNVVQIYDIGSQGDVHYFSMELVRGDSLSGEVRRQRRIDCDTAAGYILQAARGLKYAHEQGMVHRDVKPANLMLDEHGVVKVADLGLVKLETGQTDDEVIATDSGDSQPIDAQITRLGVSVGTPSYMAPEQWKKSSEVDHRADIYSLGCTFYVLVTGKLPFDGRTAKEVVTKVMSEQAIPPELIVKDIPAKISSIVNRMIAKEPKDRYPNMGKLISDLEEYLGVSSSGAFSPSERHVEILEESVKEFNQNPMARTRKSISQGLLGIALILFLGGVFFSPWFAMTVAATVVTSSISYFALRGALGRTHLFNRVRDYLFSNQLWDWITFAITGLVLVAIAFFFLKISGTLIVLIAGPVIAGGLYFGIDQVLARRRRASIEQAEKLFKVLRLRGLNEDLLRQFVCKFSGDHWEEYFEELFGYPAKIQARNWLRGETGKRRTVFRWWRDPLIKWIDRRFEIREKARKIRHLEKIETQKLIAQGVAKADAKVRAKNIAKLMTENAEAWKQSQAQIVKGNQNNDQSATDPNKTLAPDATVAQSRPTLSNLSRNLDERYQESIPKVTIADRFHAFVSLFIGPRVRFLTGVILVGLCLWWLQHNGKIAALQSSETGFLDAVEIVFSQQRYDSAGVAIADEQARAIPVPLVPEVVLSGFNSVNHGILGLLLIYSATVFGWMVTIPVIAGTGIAMFGKLLGILPDGIWVISNENLMLLAGGLIAMAGIYFLNSQKEGM